MVITWMQHRSASSPPSLFSSIPSREKSARLWQITHKSLAVSTTPVLVVHAERRESSLAKAGADCEGDNYAARVGRPRSVQ